MENQMKRLSALIIGVFMVASAQTAFGLAGTDYADGDDASINRGITSVLPSSFAQAGENNFMKIEVGRDNDEGSQVSLSDSEVNGSESYHVENGDI